MHSFVTVGLMCEVGRIPRTSFSKPDTFGVSYKDIAIHLLWKGLKSISIVNELLTSLVGSASESLYNVRY